jgi:hypothetical protein
MAPLQKEKAELEAFLADGAAYEDANKTRMMESLRRQGVDRVVVEHFNAQVKVRVAKCSMHS